MTREFAQIFVGTSTCGEAEGLAAFGLTEGPANVYAGMNLKALQTNATQENAGKPQQLPLRTQRPSRVALCWP